MQFEAKYPGATVKQEIRKGKKVLSVCVPKLGEICVPWWGRIQIMTTFPNSPKRLKGVLVSIGLPNPQPSVLVFQYNPSYEA